MAKTAGSCYWYGSLHFGHGGIKMGKFVNQKEGRNVLTFEMGSLVDGRHDRGREKEIPLCGLDRQHVSVELQRKFLEHL